jgi:hypothetical protein
MPKVLIALVFAAGLISGIILNISSKSLQAADSACVIPKNYGSVKALARISHQRIKTALGSIEAQQ